MLFMQATDFKWQLLLAWRNKFIDIFLQAYQHQLTIFLHFCKRFEDVGYKRKHYGTVNKYSSEKWFCIRKSNMITFVV